MNAKKTFLVAGALALLALPSAKADLIVTVAEAAGDMSTSVPDAIVQDFNSLPADSIQNNVAWIGVGTVNQVYVHSADQYGGANDSNYAVQSTGGEAAGISKSVLTLNSASSYFGLWWSAGDSQNLLQFYSGGTNGTLIAQFVSGDMKNLPNTYKGNPNTDPAQAGLDSAEYFAFLNFYGTTGDTWDTIVFSNQGTSGFESDNWTSRVLPWGSDPKDHGPMPGNKVLSITGTSVTVTPVPEPSNAMAMLLFSGCIGAAGAAYRRLKK